MIINFATMSARERALFNRHRVLRGVAYMLFVIAVCLLILYWDARKIGYEVHQLICFWGMWSFLGLAFWCWAYSLQCYFLLKRCYVETRVNSKLIQKRFEKANKIEEDTVCQMKVRLLRL